MNISSQLILNVIYSIPNLKHQSPNKLNFFHLFWITHPTRYLGALFKHILKITLLWQCFIIFLKSSKHFISILSTIHKTKTNYQLVFKINAINFIMIIKDLNSKLFAENNAFRDRNK